MRRVLGGGDLTEKEAYGIFGEIMDAAITPVQAAGLLTALAAKGESRGEVTGAARAMRERALHVRHELPLVLDVVGTGGDGANTINISTMAALIVAADGIPVAKHGNRAASSACGSADVLEAAGMTVDIDPQRAARMLRETNFTFLFAPRYHPAMKNVAPVRRELGVRTIFNILGPLTNPASATIQIVGVAREEQLELVGDVLRELGVRAGAVIHAGSGLDEIAGDGPTSVYSFDENGSRRWVLDPAGVGVTATLNDLRGGSVEACRDAFGAILAGERSARADVVALNAALALLVCGRCASIAEGVERAREVLRQGSAAQTFERARTYAHA